MFCAMCADDLDPADARDFEGAKICADCDEGEIISHTPERLVRGYEAPGGLGGPFQRQLGAAHDRIVPPEVVRLDKQPVVTKADDTVPIMEHVGMSDKQKRYRFGNKSNNRSRDQ